MQAALDDRSLQAMKLVARTGQTVAQLSDLRSIDEKFADTELLKSRVRTDLLTITDAVNTNSIMGALNPAELRYVAQNFDTLAKEIRPKYKMGILEAQFMRFLQSYIAADALAPVVGRPVSAADLHASSELAPTRNQINRIGHIIQTTSEAHAPRADPSTPSTARVSARRSPPTQAESIARADALGIPTRRTGADGTPNTGRAYSAEHLQGEIARKLAEDDASGYAAEDPSGHAFWQSPPPSRALAFSPPAAKATPKSALKAKAPPNTAPARMGARGIVGRGVNRVPLGRYTIDARSLGDNVVKIKSQKGAAVARYPTEKVSAKIGSLIRKMVSGGSLQFDDLQDLDDSEKRYLHKVAVGCDLVDKCPISAPKSDAVAVEHDLFTKLVGEVVAGNNNPELIKQLKCLLLKMKTEGSLPGSQVNRVLLDLLSLGH